MKKLVLGILLLIIISCSSDSSEPEITNQSDDEVLVEENEETEGTEEESQIEMFSFSVQVNGEYFDDLVSGTIYLSDDKGDILVKKDLINDSDNLIELEVDANSVYDISFLKRSKTTRRNEIELHTFSNVQSGIYTLEAKPKRQDGSTFRLNIANSGSPLEENNRLDIPKNYYTNQNNGENYRAVVNLDYYPSSFFGSYINSEESTPRFYFKDDIQINDEYNMDYSELPQLDNQITYQIPSLNLSSVDLYGYLTNNNGIRESHNIQFDGGGIRNPLFYPSDIFDNYKLSVWLDCCNDNNNPPISFRITYFGQPESRVFQIPNYSANLISSNMGNFMVETNTNHDFSVVSFFDDLAMSLYDDRYFFSIHKLGSETISLTNKVELFNNIFLEEEIQSVNMIFSNLKLITNTYSTGTFSRYIQSQIEDKEEYPEGTFIESGTFYLYSFN